MYNDKNDYSNWLDRHLEGDLTTEDWTIIDKKIQEDADFAQKFALDLAILRGARANAATTQPEKTPVSTPVNPVRVKKNALFNRWEMWVGLAASLALLFLAWIGFNQINALKNELASLKKENSQQVAIAHAEKDALMKEMDSLRLLVPVVTKIEIAQNGKEGTQAPLVALNLPLDWQKKDLYLNKFRREEEGWVISAGVNDNLADWKTLFFKKHENGKALLAIRKTLQGKPKIVKDQDADLCYYGGVLNLYVKPDTAQLEEAITWLNIVKDTFVDKAYPPRAFMIEALCRSSKRENVQKAKATLKQYPDLRAKLPEDILQYLNAIKE
jgi:hypothetical protein